MKPRVTLGISGFYNSGGEAGWGHDPAAAIVKDGELVAAAAEERFVRVKHAIGHFPYNAMKFCLDQAGITLDDVDAVGWSNNPPLAARRWADAGRGRLIKKGLLETVSRSRHLASGQVAAVFRPEFRPWESIE